jgi:hypothetical protein
MYMSRILGLILSLIVNPCFSADLEELQEGYAWHEKPNLKMAIPYPDGWFIKEEENDQAKALFISKEDINAEGKFLTGYSLNYIQNFSALSKDGPTKYAAFFILQAQDRNPDVVLKPWLDQLATGITGMGIRFRMKKDEVVLVHYYLVANEIESSLRIMVFEAPEKEWEAAWKHGELMISKTVLWK